MFLVDDIFDKGNISSQKTNCGFIVNLSAVIQPSVCVLSQ